MTAVSLETAALSAKPILGYIPMPDDFPYRKILKIGRPKHDKYSEFNIRHPSMPCSRRAKIFAPFDALVGFDERINKKKVLYEPRRVLSEGEKEEINRKLSLLFRLVEKKKALKEPAPEVVLTYFAPCTDPENDAYGKEGSYRDIRGPVTDADPVINKTLCIDCTVIPLCDIRDIREAD